MKPIFKIGNHDYTKYLLEDGLKPSRNDLDSEESGRDLVTGYMYRSRIAVKKKWTVSFCRLSSDIMSQLINDMDKTFVQITMLDSKTKTQTIKTYYTSTINEGIQRYIKSSDTVVYDGVTFDITER